MSTEFLFHSGKNMSLLRKINWLNTLFLVFTPVVGIAGTVLLLVFGWVHWPTWVLAGSMTIVTGLSVTAGYHRLFAHKSYKAHWLVRSIFLLFASAAFEGSVLEWCTDHRDHHRYTDSEKDPYNINKGFWYAHIGWLIMLDPSKRDFKNVTDLMEDPLVRFQHRFFVPLAILMGFIFPAAIAALWGNMLSGLIVAGALRIMLNHHFTFAINSVCHWFGKRVYSERQSARDHWVTALFTFGEGFHNFHHQFPIDYRNGIRAFHFDPTKWLIRALSFVRLTSNLKRVSKDRILHYKMSMGEQKERFLKQLDQLEILKGTPPSSMDPESV
jgi:stearoyl-CoA desaturase (delta-9 desaturase)